MKKVYYVELYSLGGAADKKDRIIKGYIVSDSSEEIKRKFSKAFLKIKVLRFDLINTFLYKFGLIGFKLSHIKVFCSELRSLINAGVSHIRSLEILIKACTDPIMQTSLKLAKHYVQKVGADLAQALRFSGFPSDLVDVIQTGIETSNLTYLLKEYLDFIIWSSKNKKKIIKAVIYPFFLITLGFCFVVGQAFFIFPKLSDLFKDAQNLPKITEFMLWLSKFSSKGALGAFLAFVVMAVVFYGFIFLIVFILKKLFINSDVDSFVGKTLPARFIRMILAAFFLSSLSLSIKNGFSFVKSLESAKNAIFIKTSPFYKRVENAVNLVKIKNADLVTVFKSIFGSETYAASLIATLEENPDLVGSLERLSEDLKERVDELIEPVSSVLNTVALFIIGFVIASLLFGTYFPIYQQLFKAF